MGASAIYNAAARRGVRASGGRQPRQSCPPQYACCVHAAVPGTTCAGLASSLSALRDTGLRSLRDLSRGLLPRSLLQLLRWAGGRGHCPPASCPGTLPGSTICVTAHALGGAQGGCEPQRRDGAAHGPAPVTAGRGRRCATRRPARGRSLQTGALPSLPPPLSGAIHCDTNQFSGAALIRSCTHRQGQELARPC